MIRRRSLVPRRARLLHVFRSLWFKRTFPEASEGNGGECQLMEKQRRRVAARSALRPGPSDNTLTTTLNF